MARASFVAILALLASGAAALACTNSPEDFGDFGGGGSSGSGSRRQREPSAASGEISGDPATPNEETLNGASADDPADDTANQDAAPPPSSGDAGTPPSPDPDPDPEPEPNPIPPGSFAAGTELVTTANLNIRQGADTSYAIITTAPNGSRLTVVTVSGANGWVNVSWNGNVGWSSKAYLSIP